MTAADTHPATPERTLAQAVMDVRYGYHYGALNERAWQHIDTACAVVGAVGGSAAVAGVLAASPMLSLVAGVAMGTVSMLQLVLRPGARAVEFRDAKRAFAALDARAWQMPLADLDAELTTLQAHAPTGLAGLAMPAHNANVSAIGREDCRRALSRWERWMLLLA